MDGAALTLVSKELNVPPAWLNNLITFESGWKPEARNPYSGARGLIQFTNTTAREMGYSSADDLYDKNPSDTSQLLGPVLKYLKKYAPFPTEQSLYMAVFYPTARAWPLDTAFPDSIQKLNPGIKTVHDYVDKVRHAPLIKTGISLAGIVLIAGLGLVSYQYFFKPLIEREYSKWTAQKDGKQLKLIPPRQAEEEEEEEEQEDGEI